MLNLSKRMVVIDENLFKDQHEMKDSGQAKSCAKKQLIDQLWSRDAIVIGFFIMRLIRGLRLE